MKKYNVDDSGVDECEYDEWVPASVAQALYDALVECRYDLLVGLQAEFGPKIAASWKSIDQANKALSLADGEE